MTQAGTSREPDPEIDVAIVGAGFAGMYLIHRLRKRGFSVLAFEAGGDVGGTWYWNRYPGARVDIVSVEYSYQFSEELQQEWDWSEKYATQPELLEYARHVAERFDLRRDIRFNTRVTAASFDEVGNRWLVTTHKNEQVSAKYVVLATGTLSTTNLPSIPGIETYRGDTYHTGQWPHHAVDFSGKRVGVIGTGSSGCQAIPLIAQRADHLLVFQRTANYVIPARNELLNPGQMAEIKKHYRAHRELNTSFPFAFFFESTQRSALELTAQEREREFEASWQRGGLMFLGTFTDLLTNDEANASAQDFLRSKLREIVQDPATADQLMPQISLGCKRLIVGTDYYETYNRPNVSLVSIKDKPIERISPKGIVVDGREYEVDAIVFATGFDAISGPILAIDIRGPGGLSLREKWVDGPSCYLGLMVAGFPNLFTITGPGSPSVLSNVVKSIEQHVDFIADCLSNLRSRGSTSIEAEAQAERDWVQHVDEIADQTVFKSCDSWYLGSNIPGKPRVFTAYFGWPEYAKELAEIVTEDYRGFTISE